LRTDSEKADPDNPSAGFNQHIAKYLEAHSKLQEGEGEDEEEAA
jgi:hypothetical protein